jgi:hypothetical protein
VIRIATYSIADGRFARALQAANRRCVSVQVLMNSHLTAVTSPSYGRIQRALGKRRKHVVHQRSFAHRCSNGCLGTAVLHSKIYLFSRAGRAKDVVMTGSSNMTRNAVGIQWNDLYTVNDNAKLFGQYRHMFGKMRPDRPERGPWVVRDGRYETYFYPFRRATRRTDLTMRALESIRCSGARAPAGAHGHTVVYIAMHSWFEERGTYLARRVRQMYDHGCRVRILYSFISHRIYRILTSGTGPRMQARRVLFAGASGLVASKYSHMKMFAASGRVGRNPSDWVVWTGSNNWTNKARHADEVTLRISSRSVYRAYVRRWQFMRARRSSPVWALFEEPTGGGRAPAPVP